MDKKQILSVMLQAFKSFTVSNIEILELDRPFMSIRVVAEGYSKLEVPERVSVLTELLRTTSPVISLNYAISFEPLTPYEYTEWYGKEGTSNQNNSGTDDIAAKPFEYENTP